RRMRLGGFAHERADATLSAEDAGTLQFRIDLGHCIGVDAEIDGKLPNGRKLRTAAEPTGDDLSADGALELRINGSRVAGVDGEHGAAYYYTRLLVQHKQPRILPGTKGPGRPGGRPGCQLGFRANRSALEDDKVLGLRPEPVGILNLEVAVETRSVTRRDISVVEALPRYDPIIATRVW